MLALGIRLHAVTYDSWFNQQAYLIKGASEGIEAESAKEEGGKPVGRRRGALALR